MHVVGCLEKAATNCLTSADNEEEVADWDTAVAFYTGSEARADGNGGHFIYTLAQVECEKFGTCKKGDMAPINIDIFDLFNDGKAHLQQGNCDDVAEKASEIKALVTVPLIQGAMRAMYALDVSGDYQETTQGQGAAFAAAILPLVDECNEGNANIIHNDLAPGKTLGGSFEVIKAAFERSYDCLGITCNDVGGIINLRGNGYLTGAEACDNAQPVESDTDYDDQFDNDNYVSSPSKPQSSPSKPQQSDSSNGSGGGDGMNAAIAALLSGLVFGIFGLVGGAAITLAYMSKKNKKDEKEFVTSSDPKDVADRNIWAEDFKESKIDVDDKSFS